jgi:uncharacterized protein (TIGR02466 family)
MEYKQKNGSIVPIFPTPVGSYDFDNEIKSEVLNFVKNDLTYTINASNKSSIESNLLDFPVMKQIKAFIEMSLKEYTKTVYDHGEDISFHITQSWANITGPSNFHHRHLHPNSIISGVMYLETNDDDKIQFLRDTEIYKKITLDSNSFNDFNVSFRWFHAWAGKLYLFPSTLMHDVPRTSTESENRISIAFNTFVKGRIGNNGNKTEAYI